MVLPKVLLGKKLLLENKFRITLKSIVLIKIAKVTYLFIIYLSFFFFIKALLIHKGVLRTMRWFSARPEHSQIFSNYNGFLST